MLYKQDLFREFTTFGAKFEIFGMICETKFLSFLFFLSLFVFALAWLHRDSNLISFLYNLQFATLKTLSSLCLPAIKEWTFHQDCKFNNIWYQNNCFLFIRFEYLSENYLFGRLSPNKGTILGSSHSYFPKTLNQYWDDMNWIISAPPINRIKLWNCNSCFFLLRFLLGNSTALTIYFHS